MRQRLIDLRIDKATAAHFIDALRLQNEYGYDYACAHLRSLGVHPQLAQRLLSIRYDRRARQACDALGAVGP